jgi:hypothetical protein
MTPPRTVFIDGLALWSPTLPGWEAARPALRHMAAPLPPAPARPSPPLLTGNERRRAPDAVLLALEVAGRAIAGSGHDARDLASVFTSAHGDLATTDALCRTLADNPRLLSPTRFHHSVHNAPSGYWAIASGSQAASTALAAGPQSFAAGLLEAACQCAADARPVLLVGCDTDAVGALASVNRSRGLLAVALVLAPTAGAASRWALDWQLQSGQSGPGGQGGTAVPTPARSPAAQGLAANALADALPLFEALAGDAATTLTLSLTSGRAPALCLALALHPLGSGERHPSGA